MLRPKYRFIELHMHPLEIGIPSRSQNLNFAHSSQYHRFSTIVIDVLWLTLLVPASLQSIFILARYAPL